MELCSIGELALLLGVAVVTLRRWHAAGKLLPDCRTLGGHRRYCVNRVRQSFGLQVSVEARSTVAYARVSSHDQKEQLNTQALRLQQHCQPDAGVMVLKDLGSGMNYRKPGLAKLLRMLLHGKVERLVLVTKDRLLRFGAELVFQLCKTLDVEVVILDAESRAEPEQQLTRDLIEILTVFSSRLYGTRSRKAVRAVA